MAKNYTKQNSLSADLVPRKKVIEAILSFSKAYSSDLKERDFIDLLRN
jgi:hypothetical protein